MVAGLQNVPHQVSQIRSQAIPTAAERVRVSDMALSRSLRNLHQRTAVLEIFRHIAMHDLFNHALDPIRRENDGKVGMWPTKHGGDSTSA